MLDYLKVIIIGLIGGLLAGSLGTTTATTTMMGLLALNLVPDFATAVGTTLLSILPPLSLFAAYEYYKRKKINLKYAIILMLACPFAEWVGAKFTKGVPEPLLKRILAGYLFIVGFYMIYDSFKASPKKNSKN